MMPRCPVGPALSITNLFIYGEIADWAAGVVFGFAKRAGLGLSFPQETVKG
jgi:hypothetical protein